MNRLLNVALLVGVCLVASGCAPKYRVTPVTAVPTTPEEEGALAKALQGDAWRFKTTIYEDGRVEDAGALLFVHMDFAPDGVFTYRVQGSPQVSTYKVEGKNVVTTHPNLKTIRVDSVSPNELKVFVYEMSLTWIWTR
jgi:hypothetical protein